MRYHKVQMHLPLEQRSTPSGRVIRELLQCEFDARWRVRDGYIFGMSISALEFAPNRREPVWTDREFVLLRRSASRRLWGSVEPVLPPPSPSGEDLTVLAHEVRVSHAASRAVEAAVIHATGVMKFHDEEQYDAAKKLVASILAIAPRANPAEVMYGANMIAAEWPGMSVIDGLRCIQMRLQYGHTLERALQSLTGAEGVP